MRVPDCVHALARPDRTVVMYDQAGGGARRTHETSRTRRSAIWSTTFAELLDRLGLDDVDVLGHSFGVTLALQFVLDFPRRVRSMVLASGGASTGHTAGGFISLLLADQGPEAVAPTLSAEVRGDYDDPAYWAIVGAFLERSSFPARDRLADPEAAARWRAEFDSIGPMGHALWGPWQFTATGSLQWMCGHGCRRSPYRRS